MMDSHLQAFIDRWKEEAFEAPRAAVQESAGVPVVSPEPEPDPEDLKPFLPSDEDE